MGSPSVSIIVPVFNTAPWLERCLNSLLNQSLKTIEVIMVDDASADNSKEIMKEYCNLRPDIFKCCFHESNMGLGATRNTGMAQATGEFLGFIDSDDYVASDMFAAMYEQAVEKESDIVLCGYTEISEDGRSSSFTPEQMSVEQVFSSKRWQPSACMKLFRRKFVSDNSLIFPTSSFAEDMAFMAKALMLSPKLSVVEQAFYYYCKRRSSLTFTLRNRCGVFDAFNDVYLFCEQSGLKTNLKPLRKLFIYQAIYYPACLVIIDAIIKGQNRLKNIKDIPAYTSSFLRFCFNRISNI